jgi:AcrR family transcriptional regulator
MTKAGTKVLDAAEQLFSERGFASVTLRDIASACDLTHAALYYHMPGGKTELYVAVTERLLERHRQGLEAAIAEAGEGLESKFLAVAGWLLENAPMDLLRMTYSDMPQLDTDDAERLGDQAFASMLMPIAGAVRDAAVAGEVEAEDPVLIAGGLVGMIESLHAIPERSLRRSRMEMARGLIGTLMRGLER